MKKFTKLALVSSLAISANAMAMQAMDDASLGADLLVKMVLTSGSVFLKLLSINYSFMIMTV